GRDMFNQTLLVDVSVQEVITTTSSTTVTTTSSDTTAETEESSDSDVLTDITSMFSTSMAPPQPTGSDQEAQLITTVAPTIKEDFEIDDLTEPNVFDINYFVPDNFDLVESVPSGGDVITETQMTTETTGSTASIEDPDAHAVIEISTIRPDVLLPDDSLSTMARFAEGKTEKTVVTLRSTTDITSDITDTPTESTELSSKDMFSSSESTPSTAASGFQSTTPVLDYDGIITDLPLQGPPPVQPFQEFFLPSSSDRITIATTSTTMETLPPNTGSTTLGCNTKPGNEINTTEPTEAFDIEEQATPKIQETDPLATSGSHLGTSIQVESKALAEDVMLSRTELIFSESSTQMPGHREDMLTEDDTKANIGAEIFTISPMASAVTSILTATPSVVTEDQFKQTSMEIQNTSDWNSFPQMSLHLIRLVSSVCGGTLQTPVPCCLSLSRGPMGCLTKGCTQQI
ncbi:hypothetical protein GOODEAATRI_015182, partial [Goodea atripinnis]